MMTMNTSSHADETAEIWTPVVGLASGETLKLVGGLSYAAAVKAADIEADKLAANDQPIEWAGARRLTH